MKKLFLLSTLIITQLTFAKTYEYEISPMIGYTFNDSYLPLDNYPIYGLEAQFNNLNLPLAPELSFYYEKGDYNNGNNEQPNIYTVALRGVYEFDRYTTTTLPFGKIGISNRTLIGNNDELRNAVFLDLGFGTKINFSDAVTFKIESLYMINYNNDRVNQHISILAGLNFAFGNQVNNQPASPVYKTQEIYTQPKPKKRRTYKKKQNTQYMAEPSEIKPKIEELPKIQPIIIKNNANLDDDKDGVINSLDDCLNTPSNTQVNAYGCQIIEKSIEEEVVLIENDIVEATQTDAQNLMESETCLEDTYRKIANLNIKFQYKSFNLTEDSREELFILSSFLQENPAYNVKIIGYTDNVASQRYNKKLSKKRANAIKKMLIESDIDEDRIYAIGLGENHPVATNSTKEGRAKNRRTEIILIKE